MDKKQRPLIEEKAPNDGPRIVDYKVTLLIAAGAAMAANCEPCLNKVVPDLIEAGVLDADIRRAVEIGQFVKDRPAAIMKEAADLLTGTRLSKGPVSEGCPADKMKNCHEVFDLQRGFKKRLGQEGDIDRKGVDG